MDTGAPFERLPPVLDVQSRGGANGWGNRAVRLCTPSVWPGIPMVDYPFVASLNLTLAMGKRLLNDP